MLKKFLTLILLAAMLLNASGAEILAAEVGSFVAQKSNNAPKNLLESFGEKKRFKLFEPARYGFLNDDNARQFLPDSGEEEDYFAYSRAYLENIINQTEGAIELRGKTTEYIEILNPSLLLPIYGTTISMTGRKTFGLKYNAKKYNVKSTTANKDINEMVFEQEMQLKVQGKISNRIFVDIDYDDQREDAQNIAFAYRGQKGELLQSADFGDIELSLPATQFLSYSKQVFGAKMHLQHKDANLYLIGSQSKGDSKTKQFKGNSVFETVNILDLQYIRRTYYSLELKDSTVMPSWDSNATIINGSVEVYLNDHTNTGYQIAMQAADYKTCAVYPDTGGGDAPFRLLTEGVDYSVDTNKKMLIFNSQLAATDVVAVHFKNSSGQQTSQICGGTPILVKTQDDRPLSDQSTEGSYNLEIKRYYNIGTTQLSRDNGSGNFILRLLESDGSEVCPTTTTYNYCPSPTQVDYDKGIFYLREELPDKGLYNTTPVSSQNRYFFVQFNSTVKTYFLEPNIVVQSETVKVNGATMARNKDYYVDYTSGYITFYNRDLIGDNSVINVDYEVSNETKDSALLGGRLSYDFTKNISIGASILNDSNSKPKTVPQIGDMSQSITTMEADARIKDLKVADGFKISAGGEIAKSRKNNNLFGYAMIENMQEVKEKISASTVFNDWQIASNPSGNTSFFNSINWDSEEINILDINPNAVANSNEKQNVLVINYDFTKVPDGYKNTSDEVSIVFPISNYGTDFTNKTLLEFTMLGEINGPELNISFGTMDEMSDNYLYIPSGFDREEIYPTCSKYYVPGGTAVPKTEDLHCTGQLTISDDKGWVFVDPDGTPNYYNPFANNVYNPLPQPNGKIDTQDLNDNGILDSYDATSGGHFGFAKRTGVGSDGDLITDPSQTGLEGNVINFTGWKQFSREIDLGSTPELRNRWSAVQQMRITLKRNPANPTDKGTIKIANLTVSGSVWQPLDTDESILTTYGINNVDNPAVYKPIFNDSGDGGQVFRTLYGSLSNVREGNSNNVMEQALSMQYNFPSSSTVLESSVQKNFSAMDFSTHEEFHFLLYNKQPEDNAKFFLRIASDDNTYNEIEISLSPSSFPANEWRLYKLKLTDLSGDHIPDRWVNVSDYPADVTYGSNDLNYKRVGIIKAGIRRDDTTERKGEIWLNDIFLAKALVSEGEAYEADATVKYKDWLEAGAKVLYKDDLFQTPITVASKQKNKEENYFLKFKKIKYLPVEATYYRSNTMTPDVLNYNSDNTVSLLDKGEVNRKKGTVTAKYQNPSLPQVTVGYNFNSADYELLKRKDKTDNYTAAVNYTPKNQSVVKNIFASAALTNNKINYDNQQLQTTGTSIYNTDENVQNYSLKLNLVPWKGSSLVPSYSLTTADENRRFYNTTLSNFESKKYAKYATQNVGVSTSLRLSSWLTPTASYNIIIKENNNLSDNYSEYNFGIGEVKSINRNSEGNISLTLNGRDIFKDNKLLSSLTLSNNYKLQDGDAWEYVDESFNSLDKIWIRSSMGINSPYANRTTLTLRDTYTNSARWNPFKEYVFAGRLMPLNSVSIINNFSYSTQKNENLGSYYQTKNTTLPDLIFYIDNLEKFFDVTPRYLSGTSLKLKYSDIKSETLSTSVSDNKIMGADLHFLLLNTFDTNLSYTNSKTDKQDLKNDIPLSAYLRHDFTAQTAFNYKRLRVMPKFSYILDKKEELVSKGVNVQELGLISEVKEIVPALTLKFDFNLPKGFALPFTSGQYLMTNRIIWVTNISYSRRRAYTVEDNRDLFDITTNLDYEFSKNIRFTVSAAFQKFKHLYIAENSYTAYNVGTLLTVQF